VIWVGILVVSFVFVWLWTEVFADTWALFGYAAGARSRSADPGEEELS
jgi:hypothetical protein